MKIHATPLFSPPPTPAGAPKSELQLASSKARLAFEHAMGGKTGFDRPTANGRAAVPARRPSPAAARAAAAASAAAAGPAATSAETPADAAAAAAVNYAPGSLFNIKA